MEKKKIIAVFKTHFDYGYTERKEEVLASYQGEKLDKALDICEKTQKDGEKLQYKWIMSAYLLMQIYHGVEGEKKERLTKLIENGQISCHALPFTMHSPLMDERFANEMFMWTDEYVQTFGKKFPIAAKLTDNTGYSSSIIEPMVKRGIKFLHIGKNGAWFAPKVPPLFWWEDLKGNRILVMYNMLYGSDVKPPRNWKYPVWLAFCHTNDNQGVQNANYIRDIKKQARGYEFETGTLDDFAEEILKCDLSDLPVVKGELADTWIYGAASYPDALSWLRRARTDFYALEEKANALGVDIEREKREFFANALVYTEHTFGVCVQKYFPTREYDKKKLSENRKTLENYKYAELSWEDEKDYARRAQSVVERLKEKLGDLEKQEKPALPFELTYDDKYLYVNIGGKKAKIYYEYRVLGVEKLNKFLSKTLTRYHWWAVSDMGKLWYPEISDKKFISPIEKVEKKGEEYEVTFRMNKESVKSYGNFKEVKFTIKQTEDGLSIRMEGKGKEAINLVEIGNFVVDLGCDGKKFTVEQIGQEVDVNTDLVPNTNQLYWAMDNFAKIDHIRLQSIDAPLVSFGKNGIAEYTGGVQKKKKASFYINLFNNHWGTNFPQWMEGDYSFEFVLSHQS